MAKKPRRLKKAKKHARKVKAKPRAKKVKKAKVVRAIRIPKVSKAPKMPGPVCPFCDGTIELRFEVEDGEIINCSECERELIIVKRGKNISVKKIEQEWGQEEVEEPEFEEFE